MSRLPRRRVRSACPDRRRVVGGINATVNVYYARVAPARYVNSPSSATLLVVYKIVGWHAALYLLFFVSPFLFLSKLSPRRSNKKKRDSRTQGTGRRVGQRARKENLISVTTATEATKDNGGRQGWPVPARRHPGWIYLRACIRREIQWRGTILRWTGWRWWRRRKGGKRERGRERICSEGMIVKHWVVAVAGGLWPTSAASFDPPLA